MRKLYKHRLNSEPTLIFLKSSLGETNLLSTEILNFICSHKGKFFSLLPKDADLAKLHHFDQSILPEMPKQRGPVGTLPGIYTYSMISSIEEELCDYLVNKIKKNSLHCIFDHFNATYNDSYRCEFFDSYGRYYEKEIYYFVSNKNVSKKNILECLHSSKTFWHSLCILTKATFQDTIDKTLSKEQVQEICLKACLVIVGAYDGEGYIFWEKTSP